MPRLTDTDHAAVYDYLRALESGAGGGGQERSAPVGLNAGAYGYGAGGPTFLDANHQKRPPMPHELVDAYKNVAYACIGLNMKGVAKVPLRLYAVRRSGQAVPRRAYRTAPDAVQRRMRGLSDRGHVSTGLARAIDTNDEVDEVLDHQFLDAMSKPNPYFDRELLIQYLVCCLDAVGSAFLYPERPPGPDGTADPTWASSVVWPLQPQHVFPVKGTEPGEILRSWRYFGDNFAPHELVRLRHLSLRDPYLSGYAPLHAAYEQASLVDYYTASVEGILRGGARPEVIVGSKDPMFRIGDDEGRRFEADINRRFAPGRGHRVWVIDGAFDAKTLTYSPTDLGGLELTKEQRLLVANCLDVPISLLQLEDSNRATAQESTHQHQYYGIDPRCRLIAAALTAQWAQPVDDRLFWFFDDPVVRDTEQETRVWGMRVEKGQATVNEWRANDGLPPVPWGDEPWLPNTLVQPSQAEADREAKAKLAAALPAPGAPAGEPETEPEPAPDETGDPAPDPERSALDARAMRLFDTLEAHLNARTLADHPGDDRGGLAGGALPE